MNFFMTIQDFNDWGLLILRLAIAASFMYHGLDKMKMWKMQPSEKMPSKMLSMFRLLSVVEPLGAIAFILGFLTPIAAIGFIIIMIGAIRFKTAKWQKKFADPGGWELDLVLLLASLAVFFTGAGPISLDQLIFGLG